MADAEKFYILCEGGRDLALWWGPERSGYVVSLDLAGKYDEAEARSIERIRGTRAILCSLVDSIAIRVVGSRDASVMSTVAKKPAM